MLFLEESVSSVQLTHICCVRAGCAQIWGMDAHPYSETRGAGLKATVLSSSTSCPHGLYPSLKYYLRAVLFISFIKEQMEAAGHLVLVDVYAREARGIFLILRAGSFSFGLTGPFCCWCSVTDLCPTLCDPMGCSPPVSSVHGIPQARILNWAAISSSRGSSWLRD